MFNFNLTMFIAHINLNTELQDMCNDFFLHKNVTRITTYKFSLSSEITL